MFRKYLFICAVTFSSLVFGSDDAPLRMSVEMPEITSNLTTNINVRVKIENTENKEFYLYTDSQLLLSVFASTESGQSLPLNFIPNTFPPPPKKENFTKLLQGQPYTFETAFTPKELGISGKGKYHITFIYHSNFNQKFTHALNVFNGKLTSIKEISVKN